MSVVRDETQRDEQVYGPLDLKVRRAWGADHHDEVWDGVYVMSPLANDEPQRIVMRLAAILELVIGMPGRGEVRSGVNVSDRERKWRKNYRIPDVAVRLEGGRAKIQKAHWWGGPDLAVEIVTPRDRSPEKLDFYAKIGTRELLLIERKPWAIELYRLEGDTLMPSGAARPGGAAIASAVVPLEFRLVGEARKPQVEVRQIPEGPTWRF